MNRGMVSLIGLLLLGCMCVSRLEAFVPRLSPRSSVFTGTSLFSVPVLFDCPSRGRAVMAMRDMSASYWFQVGDRVRVVEDVYKSNANLKGRVGKVCETWEKCDVDPTCCCAEQVDVGMSVRVVFDDSQNGERLEHYFAETELTKAEEPNLQ